MKNENKRTFIQHNVIELKENAHPEINSFVIPADIIDSAYNNIITDNLTTVERSVAVDKGIGENRVQK